ncbi:EF-hand domain-containing protein [Antarcticimicrobium luteum]|uniref:EF-hand domain-containing protein n=2 Tax=Antarcticimicrobium luteum TaxID=2547397 RepID=A0A4R5UX53_9RHOB|nr:EF-hand domain-containing protein [Antarcticimicrobium luteum]
MRRLVLTATALGLISGAALAAGSDATPPAAATPAFAPHFIENWDLDGDGKVTRAEAHEQRGNIFYMFDADENGALDGEEYDLFDETRAADMANAGMKQGQGRRNSPAALLAREYNDADGNGEVSKEEFLGTTDAWFDRMDRTGDGVVTIEDFGRGMN